MEASEILKMVEDALYNRFLIIDIIDSNYGITMRDMLKNTSKGAQDQVMKESKVKLDEEIPKPSFLADGLLKFQMIISFPFLLNKNIHRFLLHMRTGGSLYGE